jgi:hypothetical protein
VENEMDRSNLSPYASSGKVAFIIMFSILILSFRGAQSSGTDLMNPALWAEDGSIFLQQALDLGLRSIVEPYAGYLHVFPRVIALLATLAPLELVPLIFHAGWLLAFCFFIFFVYRKISKQNYLICLFILTCIVLQPQAGEIFFSLTNAQWFIGAALFIFILSDLPKHALFRNFAFIMMGCLTGPFCIFMLPAMLLRVWIFNDIKKNAILYMLFVVCVVIQLMFVISSEKLQFYNYSDKTLLDWVGAVHRFLVFGEGNALIEIAAMLFWIIFPWWKFRFRFADLITGKPESKITDKIVAITIFFFGLGMMILGFLRDDISIISPVISESGAAAGSRYYFIPYTMILISASLLLKDHPINLLALLCVFCSICVFAYTKTQRLDMHWDSYSKLSEKVPDVIVPIAPRIGSFPGWSVKYSGRRKGHGSTPVTIPIIDKNFELINGYIDSSKKIRTTSSDSLVIFNVFSMCPVSSHVGLKISINRENPGWVHILWSKEKSFNDINSSLRYYPAGDIEAVFAFELRESDYVAIRATFEQEPVTISEIKAYCLN